MMIRDRRTMLLAAALALAVSGCGDQKGSEPRISVKGKLLESGKPFVFDQSRIKLPPGTSMPPGTGGEGLIRLSFLPTEGGDVTYAKVDASLGRFEASIPKPGRYKIALTLGGLPPGTTDPLGATFTPENTRIVRDLKDGDEIVIDIAKPQG
jgi:hypothetical protein